MTMFLVAVTEDATPEDKEWRERVERDFPDVRPDPAQRNRYPAGYWQACWEAWKAEENAE